MTISLPATYTDYETIYHTLPDVGLNGITPEQVSVAAGEAEAEINGNLAGRYSLPIGSAVPLLTSIATDIAIYKILTSLPFTAEQPTGQLRAAWLDRYRAAVAMLLRLASGDLALVDVAGALIAQAPGAGSAFSTTMNYVPTFGESADQGFTVDRDKIDAEAARRA